MHREGQTIETRFFDAVKIGDTKAAAALVFDLVRLRNPETQNRIIDLFGEKMAEIKNSYGLTLAQELARHGDSGVWNRIIDLFGERIAEIKTHDGRILAEELVVSGDNVVQNRIIDLFGERIAEIKNSYGWTLAEVLVEYGDGGVWNRIIDLFGERIAEIKTHDGRILAEELVVYGDSGVWNRIIDIFGERIAEIKTSGGWILAEELVEYGDSLVVARVLLAVGKINKDEEEFTKRVLSNLDVGGDLKLFNLLLKHKKVSDLSLVEDYFIKLAGLHKTATNRLIEAMGKGTEVERIVAVRGIYSSISDTSIEDLKSIVMSSSGNILKSIGMLPAINDFYRSGMIGQKEKSEILKSDDVGVALGRLLVGKVGESFGADIVNEEAKDAIAQKPNFVTDLIRFNLLYSAKAPNAHVVLTNAMKAYLQRGTNGLKDFKFHGHELADNQLGIKGADLIAFKEKLFSLDTLSTVALQKTASNAAENLKTDILNYNAHRDELKKEANRIRSEAKKDLNSLASQASKELKGRIERRDIEGMRRQNLGEEEYMKRKAIALLLEYRAVDAIGSAEALIDRINKDENTQDLTEMLREDNKDMAENIVESLNMLKKRMKKSEPGSVMLPLENLIGIVSYLNKPISRDKGAIRSTFTFDPSEILTFGRYGSSGGGNCQNSNAVNADLNQSLMSMLADSNQLMIRFTSPSDDKTLGFAQVHILQSDRGTILLLENPYTNQPDKSEAMHRAAESLVVSSSNELGIKAYVRDEKGERTVVTIPKSYVSRYIDFIGRRISSEEERVSVGMRKIVEEVVIGIRK